MMDSSVILHNTHLGYSIEIKIMKHPGSTEFVTSTQCVGLINS